MLTNSPAALLQFCTVFTKKLEARQAQNEPLAEIVLADVQQVIAEIAPTVGALAFFTPLEAPEQQATEAFMEWLADNVDMDIEIYFDHENTIDSRRVLTALEQLRPVTPITNPLPDCLAAYRESMLEKTILAEEGVNSLSALDTDNFTRAEDSLLQNTIALADDPDLSQALALLRNQGLSSIADTLHAIAVDSQKTNFLSEHQ
jgi:hypothetical protein